MKRIAVDLTLSIILLVVFLTGAYQNISAPVQLIFAKILIVSIAFLHAHIVRKIVFPSVDWEKEGINAKTVLVISLYIVFIYAYSHAG